MKTEIIYLSRSDQKTIESLSKSLELLYANFNNQFGYPVRIFIEKDFPKEMIKSLSHRFRSLSFTYIDFPEVSVEIKDNTVFGYGYRHMCNFLFQGILKYVSSLDWYMRLDTDSFIIDKIDYDIFQYLEKNGKIYGYVAEALEHPSACEQIEPFFLDLSNTYGRGFIDYFLDNQNKYNLKNLYNNFEIKNVRYMCSDICQQIIDRIIKSNNIYHYRWGDHLLMTFLMSITTSRDKIHRFSDVGYHHQFYKQYKNKIESIYTPNEWIENNDWIGL